MKDVRGKVLEYEGRKLLITYHPAALLRNPSWKKQTWEDVQQLRAMYDEYMAGK
jgi:DNA polymerase